MQSDIEIANAAVLRPIREIAEETLGIGEEHLVPYGHYKAKVDVGYLTSLADRPLGRLVLVTALSPTPPGEGKTTTTVGLTDALHGLGHRSMACLREPSMGPVFGMKGGAAGGGWSQVVPMTDINLHFTGDFAAIAAANNLLSALIDNHVHHGNELGIDSRTVSWGRVLDVNDRSLRNVVIGVVGLIIAGALTALALLGRDSDLSVLATIDLPPGPNGSEYEQPGEPRVLSDGETIYANLEFIDGTRGAHASISGVSGIATKTSWALFLLHSLFTSGVVGKRQTNAKALIFSVKGEDLMFLDHTNVNLDDDLKAKYARLGLGVGDIEMLHDILSGAKRAGMVIDFLSVDAEGLDLDERLSGLQAGGGEHASQPQRHQVELGGVEQRDHQHDERIAFGEGAPGEGRPGRRRRSRGATATLRGRVPSRADRSWCFPSPIRRRPLDGPRLAKQRCARRHA